MIIEPSAHLGGLSSGGLGATDIGNKAAIGGISREFYHRMAGIMPGLRLEMGDARRVFAKRGSGQSQASNLACPRRRCGPSSRTWRKRFLSGCCRRRRCRCITSGWPRCERRARALTELAMENGDRIPGEDVHRRDLRGRFDGQGRRVLSRGPRSQATYGETLNGIRAETPQHQFTVAVDPYVKPGDPAQRAAAVHPVRRRRQTRRGRPSGAGLQLSALFHHQRGQSPAAVAPPPDYDPDAV